MSFCVTILTKRMKVNEGRYSEPYEAKGWYGRWVARETGQPAMIAKESAQKVLTDFLLRIFKWKKWFEVLNVFTYSELSIDSGIPLQEIEEYFSALGGKRSSDETYLFNGLEVKVISQVNLLSASLSLPKNKVVVLSGERLAAEKFLTNFRLHFMSAGG